MYFTRKCRVCLSGDKRMYAISNTVLQETWEKLTNARVSVTFLKTLKLNKTYVIELCD